MPVRSRALFIAVVVLVGAVAAIAFTLRPEPLRAQPVDPAAGAGVQVEGVGTVTGSPDVLRVTIGVETTAEAVDAALQEASTAARRVLEAVRAEGVSEDDVATVNVSVYAAYDHNGQEITGYTARHDLEVRLRDLGRAGTAITALVTAGGDAARLQGVAFSLEDDAALQEDARAEAFAAAREKAEQYAELTGRELGDVVEVREQVTPSGPIPYAAGDAARMAESVPLVPGSATVSVTVSVRWGLR
ncbi:SIMPL domain-containing protein [Blastococcus sp. PRF04-17]|uniref:SIMPL domain-containing protein n=1 Tax=Blastococcus sp. PRF04-17 TaxID=2933797 RepID=UPI001FF0E093|nr:SIMPL domain-containing protein [Blastococcus sp. PRF04-17]UOY02408.1 SIMPL domain-containing protein [Blastococcus sp. PRF04-17]